MQTNGVIKNCLIELDIHAKSTTDAMLNSLDYHTKTKVKNLKEQVKQMVCISNVFNIEVLHNKIKYNSIEDGDKEKRRNCITPYLLNPYNA